MPALNIGIAGDAPVAAPALPPARPVAKAEGEGGLEYNSGLRTLLPFNAAVAAATASAAASAPPAKAVALTGPEPDPSKLGLEEGTAFCGNTADTDLRS